MSGDTFGFGQMVQAALDFTKYFIGDKSNTSSNTSGTGWNYTTASGETESKNVQNFNEHTVTDSYGTEATTGTSRTTNKGTTQGSTDPYVAQFMKALMMDARNNANDPSKTQGIIDNTTNILRDAMTVSFGKQNQSGLWASGNTQAINNDLIARASADAAGAVLNYQTAQQRLASDTAGELGKLLARTDVNQVSQTDTSTVKNTNNYSVTDSTKQMITEMVNRFNQRSHTDQNMTTNSDGTTKSGGGKALFGSVICTWMHQNSMLSTARYALVTNDFERKPLYQKLAYWSVASRLVPYLEKSQGKSLFARAIIEVIRSRTAYVCASSGYKKTKKTVWGWSCRAITAVVCLLPALYFLLLLTIFPDTYRVEEV